MQAIKPLSSITIARSRVATSRITSIAVHVYNGSIKVVSNGVRYIKCWLHVYNVHSYNSIRNTGIHIKCKFFSVVCKGTLITSRNVCLARRGYIIAVFADFIDEAEIWGGCPLQNVNTPDRWKRRGPYTYEIEFLELSTILCNVFTQLFANKWKSGIWSYVAKSIFLFV